MSATDRSPVRLNQDVCPTPGLLRRQAPAMARLERPGRRAVDVFLLFVHSGFPGHRCRQQQRLTLLLCQVRAPARLGSQLPERLLPGEGIRRRRLPNNRIAVRVGATLALADAQRIWRPTWLIDALRLACEKCLTITPGPHGIEPRLLGPRCLGKPPKRSSISV